MAHTATATRGLELVGYTTDATRLLVPGDPGVTYTPGDPLAIGAYQAAATGAAGLLVKVGTNSNVHAIVTGRKVVCPSASTPFPIFGKTEGNQPVFGNESQTLVEVMPVCPVGTPIWKATFVDNKDDTVITAVAATPSITVTTGMGTDNYPDGALTYVYEGPGAGEVNIVDWYDHAGHADGSLTLVMHRAFNATLTSASKVIVLSGEGAVDCGVSFFRRTGTKTATSTFEVDQHSDDGKFVVFADFRTIGQYLHQLTLPVIPAASYLLA